jgi:ribosomal 30S subunit maturation factor RimM
MAIRNDISQKEHDSVIEAAYFNLDKVNHHVYKNPDQQRNTSIILKNNEHYYPDLIITSVYDTTVKFIIEVETKDSLNNNEVQQWQKFSQLGGTFYILVPFVSKSLTELLCRQNDIKARIGTYRLQNTRYIINYE